MDALKQINAHYAFAAIIRSTLVALTLFTFLLASAAEEAPKRKTKKVQSIPQSLVKDFQKLGEAFEQENIPEAQRLIAKLEAKKTLNNISKAYIANFKGNIYFSQENLGGALREFKKVLSLKEGIPESFTSQITYVVAQVYFSMENYSEALKYAQRWFRTQEDPSADAYMLIGQAQYMLKRYDDALPNVQKGIDKYRAQGAKPKESWLNLLLGIYREKSNYKRMLPVTKQLVELYPKESYVRTLAGIYNELGSPAKMSAVLQALFDQGAFKKESDFVNLASLHLSQENPYKAVRVLEEGFKREILKQNQKNNRLYSQALFMSKEYERSVGPLEKAASFASDGKLYVQLGHSLTALDRWSDAEKAFLRALEKGKLDDTGRVYISLGSARFEQKKFDSAKIAFNKAAKFKKSAKTASNWVKYVDAELRRIAELKKPIEINVDVEV